MKPFLDRTTRTDFESEKIENFSLFKLSITSIALSIAMASSEKIEIKPSTIYFLFYSII